MKGIRLGSLCLTNVDKEFKYGDKTHVIKRGTFVSVCDDTTITKGYVLVEIEGFDTVFDYNLDELVLFENYL